MKSLAFLQPKPLPFLYKDWRALPFHTRIRMLCVDWAIHGYGAPNSVYVFYTLKIALYIGMWAFFCSFHEALGPIREIGQWWFKLEALQVAVLWSILFENLGLGCGSGPLTARYWPPFGGLLHFARPGTIKLPLFPNLLLMGRDHRGWLDALLYLAHLVFLLRALIATEITTYHIYPTVILLPLLGILDKTLYLSARAEHYLIALVCFLFPQDALAGLKLLWLAIWWGAATSKLTRHFPAVVGVMISNHALLRWKWLRKKLYKDYPKDLRPSKLSEVLAHGGTLTEFLFPLLLVFGDGGILTLSGLVIMVGFHTYITTSVPLGVPLEWNVIMVYGAFILYGYFAGASLLNIQDPLLMLVLFISLIIIPVMGNLFPKWISFLLSMRYYAGNWAYGVWMFKEGTEEKLDDHITKAGLTLRRQLSKFYEEDVYEPLAAKVIAFRHMHLHGRALHQLVPEAVEDIDEYVWRDGEVIAGLLLGWNFGEGHLHHWQLLKAVQKRCNYATGELRCIFVEAQAMHKSYMEWKIYDAKEGLLKEGRINVKGLTKLQPWPAPL